MEKEKPIQELSSEELALLLQQQYQQAVQCQENIWAINQELQNRLVALKKKQTIL